MRLLEGTVPARTVSVRTVSVRTVSVMVVAIALCVMAGCSKSSPTSEISHDASRDTIVGPRPTAPPSTDYTGPGLTGEATELIKELRQFDQQKDLCAILTSETIKTLLGGDFDVTSLVTSPSGLAQVIVVLDNFFQHLVDVSPPAVRDSMATVQTTWKQVTSIEPDALDREQRIDAIASDPQVTASVQALGGWIKENCLGQTAPDFDIASLLG